MGIGNVSIDSKKMVHRAEAVITLDRKQSNNGRILQTVRDTIQITNRGNDKPPTPTINETVFLDKPCKLLLFLVN